MGIKFLRPAAPRAGAARPSVSSAMGRPVARKVGDDRSSHLQDKLKESIMERRRLAAAHAGLPDNPTAPRGSDMTNNDVQDHIKAYIQQKGSWIERRIARLQSEAKNTQ